MNTIVNWRLKTLDDVELAEVLNFTPASDRTKIETRLYNGTYQVQTIGAINLKPKITVLVRTIEQLEAVNEAEASCELLTLTYLNRTYTGYLSGQPSWEPALRGSHYVAQMDFMVIE